MTNLAARQSRYVQIVYMYIGGTRLEMPMKCNTVYQLLINTYSGSEMR